MRIEECFHTKENEWGRTLDRYKQYYIYLHWRLTKVETTGATQDYETLISRLFETFFILRDQKTSGAMASMAPPSSAPLQIQNKPSLSQKMYFDLCTSIFVYLPVCSNEWLWWHDPGYLKWQGARFAATWQMEESHGAELFWECDTEVWAHFPLELLAHGFLESLQ